MAEGAEADCVSGVDVGDDVGRGVGVGAIGPGSGGDDGLIELLAEFVARAGDAAVGIFGEFLLGGAIGEFAKIFADARFEIFDECVEFGLKLADFLALLVFAM